MAGTCPICCETDPRPGSFCLAKMSPASMRAQVGKPCQYSVEGQDRTREAMVRQAFEHGEWLKQWKAERAKKVADEEARLVKLGEG